MARTRFMGRGARGTGRSRGCRSCRATAPSRRAAGCDAAPGQRRTNPVCRPARRWLGGDRRERAARRVVGERVGVEDRLDAGEVAVGVVVRGALAEVAQPADEVGAVRAGRSCRTGVESFSACVELRSAGRATCSRRGVPVEQVDEVVAGARAADRACAGRRSSGARRARAGAARARNGARSFVAGLEAATSTSRSSSVARRFTNVVFALRSVSGSSPSAWASDAFSSPIAAAVVFAFETRSARSPRRAASALTVRDEFRRKRVERVLVADDLVDERARRRQRRVEVLRRLRWPARPRPTYQRALPWTNCWRRGARRRVERVEELVEVDDRRRRVGRRASRRRRARGRLLAPGRQRDVAVGDARQRRRADRRRRPLVQRREVARRPRSRSRPGCRRSAGCRGPSRRGGRRPGRRRP